jgi:large subunit ribosomal protein L25
MAIVNSISVESRSQCGKGPCRRTRVAGRIPGVMYGGGGAATLFSAGVRDIARIANYGRLIDLTVDGESVIRKVLLKEVQRNYLGSEIIHVDFHEVSETQTVVQEVPIRVVGESPAAAAGALLVQQLFAIEVECSVASIPEVVNVDVSELEEEESITISGMIFPEGVKAYDVDESVLVVMLAKQRVQE